jgi:predicted exporter
VSARQTLALCLAVLAALAAIVATQLRVGSNITRMMPAGTEGTLAAIARHLTEAELSRTMVLTLRAPELATAQRAADALATALRGSEHVAWVRSGVDPEQLRAFYELYFPRRGNYIAEDPAAIPALLGDDALRARAQAALGELRSPASAFLKQLLPEDPLGLFARSLARLRGAQPDLRVVDDHFASRDGEWAVLLLGTTASAFDGASQAEFLAELDAQFRVLDAAAGGSLELESSGANRFAVAAETSIRADVQLVSLLSIAGVFALFYACFRSLPALLLASLPILAGMLVATAVGTLVFGELDGLTLGFGAALIGVVIDYPVFFLTHVAFAPSGTPLAATARETRAPIALGAVTTIGSFAGLGFTQFPGFREIALFAVVGVATALAVTLFVVPALTTPGASPPPLARRLAPRLDGWLRAVQRSRGRIAIALGLASVAALACLPRLVFVDDLSKLWRMDPALVAEDARVRERVSQLETGRFVIALASDRDTALARAEAVRARLEREVAAGTLGGLRSLHSFLWSRELQEANRAALAGSPDLAARVERAFREVGFRAGTTAPFGAWLASEPAAALRYEDLAASPLADAVRPFLLQLGADVAAVTYLEGIRDLARVRAAVADLPGVHYFDQRAFLDEVYREFRATTIAQIFVGNAIVVALLIARYRRLRPALAAYLPSVFVALFVLGGFALAGSELNLLHAIGLVMVTGMGVDYGVYVIDSARSRVPMGTTLLAVLLCCLTTLFTFGALALSRHPALAAIGVTTGIGLVLAFALAPVALLLSGARIPERSSVRANA